MWAFYLGAVTGAVLGFIICALFSAGKDDPNKPKPV